MTTLAVHLKGFDLDPALPLSQQATSLAAEIEAVHVFQAAAKRDFEAGDLRAQGRIIALHAHERQLLDTLLAIQIPPQTRPE